jgi:hypothetical protein
MNLGQLVNVASLIITLSFVRETTDYLFFIYHNKNKAYLI